MSILYDLKTFPLSVRTGEGDYTLSFRSCIVLEY